MAKNIGYLFKSKAHRVTDKALDRIANTKGYSIFENAVSNYAKHSLQGRLTKRR